jgi:uncharacterized membrane protein YeaQ/YmgE (transglycosylase-associated protein family)
MDISAVGAIAFGIVIGWICYRTLRRKEGASALSDISTVIGAVGGGTVVTLFKSGSLFGYYSIGLLVGFFSYLIISLVVYGKASAASWMGD